jgi:hypothetical protein
MSYKIVTVADKKSAFLRFTDGNIRLAAAGEYLIMAGDEYQRAKRDGVFSSERTPSNQDFEALGKQPITKVIEEKPQFNQPKKRI